MNINTENKDVGAVESKSEVTKKESRLVVSHDAEAAVAKITDAVNDGFEAGRATKFDVASFMLLWYVNNAPHDVVFEIRRHLADSLSMLDAIHKKAKASGDLPPEVKAALEQYFFGTGALTQRKVKKNLKSEYITDTYIESETI